ncbi:MAG: hypothetical protein IJU16_00685 [Clostridia bacterium]|nr:hypothetical protein [Clostridia bacterium]
MVGNNVAENMAAAKLGMAVYLVTDFLENPNAADIDRYPHDSIAELQRFCAAL